MASSATDLKTEGLAKKLAQSSNHKSNFKYLMNSKTTRSLKTGYPSKQNQIESLIVGSAHKLATKTSNFAKFDSQIYKEINVLCTKNGNMTSRQDSKKCLMGEKQFKSKQLQYDSNRFSTINLAAEFSANNTFQELKSKLKTEISQKGCQQFGCMTEDCYYQKELLIKMELLKKERDDIWNSISDIVKENLTLKEIIAQLTIDAKTSTKVGVQTDKMINVQTQIQTELTTLQIEEMFLDSKKALQNVESIKEELQELKQVCLRMIPKPQNYEYFPQVGLKDLLIQTVNLNLLNISKRFQRQKQLLATFTNDERDSWQREVINLKSQLQNVNIKLQQSLRLKQNVKKIFQKELQEVKKLFQKKQANFINQILQIKQQWQDILMNHQMKNKFYLQYFENTKDCFRQKQTLYSTLLTESHKTIQNLMAQMKQFSNMANTNYHNHLKKERSQLRLDQIFQDQQ